MPKTVRIPSSLSAPVYVLRNTHTLLDRDGIYGLQRLHHPNIHQTYTDRIFFGWVKMEEKASLLFSNFPSKKTILGCL